ncbi:MAG: hypothetical protein PCALPYG88_6235 [uncultured Paraburkholderia sp.]|uniref:hypothetical protein n=1 Tax=uncultured Paraburkholderia sp. TaxID=1822466 RepID=UPI00103BFCAE|nr:hypothetical protein [uncultured Paraburkholderia sp.]TCF97504.1 hypothetical protein BZM26_31095 [Paraburkholderia strydomiana]CAH2903070.1 MAG: hypothetical protein PCALPYG08_6475 [uncultured Paraburkholderia sp.]CAH2938375.1 MAG: hypothetical protein PCALPYG88_6235 [uncultured Paraburkholderia sp.]
MKRICLSIAFGCAMSLSVVAQAKSFGFELSPSTRTTANAPATQGWHDGRYWDGHRSWSRDEWEGRRTRAAGHDDAYRFNRGTHCPPGHAKKHDC